MEPTGMAICPSQAGALNFRITVRGRSAHGCVRDQGVSALEKLIPIHGELLALEARRTHTCSDPLFRDYAIPFPLSIGTIQGGEWPSTVLDRLQVEGRYGVAPGESLEEARGEFMEAVKRVVDGDSFLRSEPPEVEWWGGTFRPARVPTDEPVVTTLRAATAAIAGEPARLAGVTFGSDMRLLVREGGTPTVLFGPGDVKRAHAPDESVSLAEVEQTARTLILTAMRFCGSDDD
jgi:acetylornithine deacetylase